MKADFTCVVTSVEKHVLPRLYKVTCEISDGGTLVFEYHEDLQLSYAVGERLSVSVSSEKLPPSSPRDYCGKAFLYKVQSGEREKLHLFSMGGYIFRLSTPYSISGLSVAEHYYICVSPA